MCLFISKELIILATKVRSSKIHNFSNNTFEIKFGHPLLESFNTKPLYWWVGILSIKCIHAHANDKENGFLYLDRHLPELYSCNKNQCIHTCASDQWIGGFCFWLKSEKVIWRVGTWKKILFLSALVVSGRFLVYSM